MNSPSWFPRKAGLVSLVSVTALLCGSEPPTDKPAPTTDRVGFPTGYAEHFTVLRTKTDPAKAKLVTIYGNAQAASVSVSTALPYPNGAVIVMETAGLKQGADGKALADVAGKYVRESVLGLHVMRRERGFGEAYGPNRSGEWEYAEYHADGTYITRPQKTASCAECHVKAGPAKDYVFKARFAEDGK